MHQVETTGAPAQGQCGRRGQAPKQGVVRQRLRPHHSEGQSTQPYRSAAVSSLMCQRYKPWGAPTASTSSTDSMASALSTVQRHCSLRSHLCASDTRPWTRPVIVQGGSGRVRRCARTHECSGEAEAMDDHAFPAIPLTLLLSRSSIVPSRRASATRSRTGCATMSDTTESGSSRSSSTA